MAFDNCGRNDYFAADDRNKTCFNKNVGCVAEKNDIITLKYF